MKMTPKGYRKPGNFKYAVITETPVEKAAGEFPSNRKVGVFEMYYHVGQIIVLETFEKNAWFWEVGSQTKPYQVGYRLEIFDRLIDAIDKVNEMWGLVRVKR